MNNAGAPAGDYKVEFIGATAGSGVVNLYDFVMITITEAIPPAGWAHTWGGEDYDEGHGVAVDGSGHIYATGLFQGTVDFNPGPGEDWHDSSNSGAFQSKFDTISDYKWARTYWGGYGVAVADYDNIYAIGYETLVKFDSDGEFQWERTCDGARKNGLAVDGLGNVYVTGNFQGTVDFDPGLGSENHVSNGKGDVFVSKFNSEGEFQWARTWGGTNDDYSWGVAVDYANNVYATGVFESIVDFDPGGGIDEHTSKGAGDVFLSKLDSNGGFKWARTWGGSYYFSDEGYAIAVGNLGNVYVTGTFNGVADFDPGPGIDEHFPGGVLLSKFDSSGAFQWARTWGGNFGETGYGIAAREPNNIYVTGCFWNTVDFDPGPGVDEHNDNGYGNVFLSKFNSSGAFQWARTWGGTKVDAGYGVAADDSGNAYITGFFSGIVDFDPGSGSDVHPSNGETDAFMSKFRPDGNW